VDVACRSPHHTKKNANEWWCPRLTTALLAVMEAGVVARLTAAAAVAQLTQVRRDGRRRSRNSPRKRGGGRQSWWARVRGGPATSATPCMMASPLTFSHAGCAAVSKKTFKPHRSC
jgi:hypothetical protein